MSLPDWLRSVLGMSQAQTPKKTPSDNQPTETSAPKPKAAVTFPPPRSVQIGVDFGTCWSKLVIRDYESPDPFAFVLRPSGLDAGPNSEYRIPSAVTLHNGRLSFGWPGENHAKQGGATTWTSVKMRAAFPDKEPYCNMRPFPDGLSGEDLATLMVTYLLQVAMGAAVAYTTHLQPPCQPRPGVSMGVPMDLASNEHLHEQFVAIVRTAYELLAMEVQTLSAGIRPCDAAQLLTRARARLAHKGKTQRPRDWVRSEVEAGLMWIVQSPRVARGKYACIDVGAGTTDVSFFNIVESHQEGHWMKSSLLFYSAKSSIPGVDAIDEIICRVTGTSIDAVRGREAQAVAALQEPELLYCKAIAQKIHAVYHDAWKIAYPQHRGESNWSELGLFLLGGGAKLPLLRAKLSETPWPGTIPDRQIRPNDYPVDLYEAPSKGSKANPFRDEADFLLVAYGLSFMGSDVPPIEAPNAQADFNPPPPKHRPRDQDEYYPK